MRLQQNDSSNIWYVPINSLPVHEHIVTGTKVKNSEQAHLPNTMRMSIIDAYQHADVKKTLLHTQLDSWHLLLSQLGPVSLTSLPYCSILLGEIDLTNPVPSHFFSPFRVASSWILILITKYYNLLIVRIPLFVNLA